MKLGGQGVSDGVKLSRRIQEIQLFRCAALLNLHFEAEFVTSNKIN